MQKIITLIKLSVASIYRSSLWFSIAVTGAIALLLALLLVAGLSVVSQSFFTGLWPWAANLLGVISTGVFSIFAWFIFPTLAVLAAGLMQNRIITKVDKKEYGNTSEPIDSSFVSDLGHDVRFTLWALFLNLCVLPTYFLGVGPVFSILLNGYLLGKEFFISVVAFYQTRDSAMALAKKHKGPLFLSGLVLSALMLIPIVNLFMPVLAVLYMLHFYRLNITSAN